MNWCLFHVRRAVRGRLTCLKRVVVRRGSVCSNPIHSMYGIYAYIDPPNHPNVGIYGIHGASGNDQCLHWLEERILFGRSTREQRIDWTRAVMLSCC